MRQIFFIIQLMSLYLCLHWAPVAYGVELTLADLGFAKVTVAGREDLVAHCLVIFDGERATDSFCVYQQGTKKFRESDNGAIVLGRSNGKVELLLYKPAASTLKSWLRRKNFNLKEPAEALAEMSYLAAGTPPPGLNQYTLRLTTLHHTDDLNFFAFFAHSAIRGLQKSYTDEMLKSFKDKNPLLQKLDIPKIRALLQAGVEIKNDNFFIKDNSTEQLIAVLPKPQEQNLIELMTDQDKWQLVTSDIFAEQLALVKKYPAAFEKLAGVENEVQRLMVIKELKTVTSWWQQENLRWYIYMLAGGLVGLIGLTLFFQWLYVRGKLAQVARNQYRLHDRLQNTLENSHARLDQHLNQQMTTIHNNTGAESEMQKNLTLLLEQLTTLPALSPPVQTQSAPVAEDLESPQEIARLATALKKEQQAHLTLQNQFKELVKKYQAVVAQLKELQTTTQVTELETKLATVNKQLAEIQEKYEKAQAKYLQILQQKDKELAAKEEEYQVIVIENQNKIKAFLEQRLHLTPPENTSINDWLDRLTNQPGAWRWLQLVLIASYSVHQQVVAELEQGPPGPIFSDLLGTGMIGHGLKTLLNTVIDEQDATTADKIAWQRVYECDRSRWLNKLLRANDLLNAYFAQQAELAKTAQYLQGLTGLLRVALHDFGVQVVAPQLLAPLPASLKDNVKTSTIPDKNLVTLAKAVVKKQFGQENTPQMVVDINEYYFIIPKQEEAPAKLNVVLCSPVEWQ